MKLRSNTTHVVINQRFICSPYVVRTEHQSDTAATKMCRTHGRNRAEGHTVAIAVAKLTDYGIE